MIGNDVVDLVLAREQSNWRRKGFLEKVFTEAEQDWISAAGEPDKMVWLLWSMKEAAYKIFNRETGVRIFSPLSFCCAKPERHCDYYSGEVNNEGFSCCTKSYLTDDFVITESFSEKNITTYFIKDYTDYLKKGIITKNRAGQPFIGEDIPVSVSHHGRFCIISIYSDGANRFNKETDGTKIKIGEASRLHQFSMFHV